MKLTNTRRKTEPLGSLLCPSAFPFMNSRVRPSPIPALCSLDKFSASAGISLVVQHRVDPKAGLHPWSADVLSLVASGLGLGIERPGGVKGCCVPGMWCSGRGCYTLAVGGDSFSNFGGYVGIPGDVFR